MARSLSSDIATYAASTGADDKAVARHFRVSITTVREAVLAWKIVREVGPTLAFAERTIREVDKLAPLDLDDDKAEARRLREERQRRRITVHTAAIMCGMSVRKYRAIERGDRADVTAYSVALRIQYATQHWSDQQFDAEYVAFGRRRGA